MSYSGTVQPNADPAGIVAEVKETAPPRAPGWLQGPQHSLLNWRLKLDRRLHRLKRGARPFRAMATACWHFPIYSQTFVYQELTQLAQRGFDIKMVYSLLEPRSLLRKHSDHLWKAKRRLNICWQQNKADFEDYLRRMPDKVEALARLICDASGMSQDQLYGHWNWVQAFTFTRMAENYRPHYLHSYFFYDRAFMAMVAGFMLDIPRGVSCYADHRLQDYELKLVPLHLRLADLVIATSNGIKQDLLDIEPEVDVAKIIVKPNAINASQFEVIERVEPGATEGFRLCCVSRIEPKKGLEYLAEALRILLDRGVKVRLDLVGEQDAHIESSVRYNQELRRRVRELGLEQEFHFCGRQDELGVRRYLGQAQLFVAAFVEVASGDSDGIPTAMMEAMATGLPAVTTDAGSIPELVEDGRQGLVVGERDAAAMAEAIETLLRDPERRAQMGQESVRKVHAHYDVKVCEPVFHDRLLELMDERWCESQPCEEV